MSTYEAVEASRGDLASELGQPILDIAVMYQTNSVDVGVEPQLVGSAQEVLNTNYDGVARAVAQEGPSVPDDCRGSRRARDLCPNPLRGGVTVQNEQTGLPCTMGYNARNGAGTEYVITAGHCGSNGQTYSHNFPQIGYVAFSDRENSGVSDVDAARVLRNNSNLTSSRWIIDESSSDAFQTREAAGLTEYLPGDYICLSGIMNLKSCGGIQSVTASGAGSTNQIQTAYCRTGGDSGGPVYDDLSRGDQTGDGTVQGAAVGLHVGGREGACVGFANKIGRVQNVLQVTIRTY